MTATTTTTMRVSLVFASAFLSRLSAFASSLCRRTANWFRVFLQTLNCLFAKEKRKLEKRDAVKETVILDARALYDDDDAASSVDDFDDAVVVGLEKVVVVVSIPVGKRRSRLSRFEAVFL